MSRPMKCRPKQFTTLHKLYKKAAKWVTKMLYEEMKKERFRMCEAVIAMTIIAF